MSNRLLLAVAAIGFASRAAAQAPCGGVERWAVKVAADPAAAQINATPQPTTLHELVRLQRPGAQETAGDVARAAAERQVYVVDAFLVRFKKETGKTGDQDYHLVISDETGGYSRSTGPVSSHSFIAEIPDPACVAGRNNTVSGTSRFPTELQATLTTFEQRFPTITSGWNDVGPIPVRLTGVAFFDRDHKQVGRARNGLELHPLLDITFNPPALLAGVTPPATTTLALTNPGFEQGTQDWTSTADVITNDASQPARAGQWKAWLGGWGETHTDRVARIVTLPSTGTAMLRFHLHVVTEEQNNVAYDKFHVRVRTTSGTVGSLRQTLLTLSNLNASAGYTLQSVDLSAYRGQTIRLSLEAVEDNGSATSFVVDDVAIVIEP